MIEIVGNLVGIVVFLWCGFGVVRAGYKVHRDVACGKTSWRDVPTEFRVIAVLNSPLRSVLLLRYGKKNLVSAKALSAIGGFSLAFVASSIWFGWNAAEVYVISALTSFTCYAATAMVAFIWKGSFASFKEGHVLKA
jgi:hypothetical protein